MNGSIKVLHVDDEPALLDQAKIFLEKEEVKLDLTPAQTPKKTLELLEKEDFDVIVSDYQMPDMDGLEFLEEVKGKTVHEVWPETEEEWIERYGEVAVTGESQTFDLYHSPTDKMYHCNVYRPYETRDRFCVIFEDISEKEEREQKLRKERKKFQEIFNNANDAIYLYELTEEGMPGEFIEVNDVAEEMLGYNRKEFLQMSPPDIDAQEKADEILEIAKELVDRGEMRFEMVHQTKDGTKIPVEIHSHVFELEGEKRVLSVARDITERKEAEEREEFLHSLLRHDVQNKTRLVKGYLDLLEEDVDLPDEAKDYIQKAEKVTKASEEIIEKVRKLNQIKEEDEIKEIDIDSVLDQVLTEHESQLKKEGIDIEVQISGCTVKGGTLLQEMISNLVENSIKHSDCDKIRIKSECEGDECIVTVEDDGKGISDEVKEKIFDRGFTKGENAGSGLGMYLVKEIVGSYGGRVEVKDSELGGARFDVRLKKSLEGGDD